MSQAQRSSKSVKSAARRAKPAKQRPLTIEDFRYVEDLGVPLPQLILGIRIPPGAFNGDYPLRTYSFKPGRTWLNLAHETAGTAKKQRCWFATLLTPKATVSLALRALCDSHVSGDLGAWGCSLDELIEYRAKLKALLAVDCNQSHRFVEKGALPIDVEYVRRLVLDDLPTDLDELINWDSGIDRARNCVGRWDLTVLGPNGDNNLS